MSSRISMTLEIAKLSFYETELKLTMDNEILLNGIIFYIEVLTIPEANSLPFWRIDGVIQIILIHVHPVEFLYYWFHRELHHHYLYSHYHSHHHSSILSRIHLPEHIGYFTLFAIPLLTTVLNRYNCLNCLRTRLCNLY
ncbi:hypothetical protein RJ641_016518 [Dillenia turbinata]|uniref:Fatty acid hydroxylase domain-containing protein n=1 Tax=Dillenia turbinata TaxID=194707 RepID=A0AAN8UU28_9MAGN